MRRGAGTRPCLAAGGSACMQEQLSVAQELGTWLWHPPWLLCSLPPATLAPRPPGAGTPWAARSQTLPPRARSRRSAAASAGCSPMAGPAWAMPPGSRPMQTWACMTRRTGKHAAGKKGGGGLVLAASWMTQQEGMLSVTCALCSVQVRAPQGPGAVGAPARRQERL